LISLHTISKNKYKLLVVRAYCYAPQHQLNKRAFNRRLNASTKRDEAGNMFNSRWLATANDLSPMSLLGPRHNRCQTFFIP